MAIIYSLKCTVPLPFVVPLLSLALTDCHLLSLVVSLAVTLCHLLYHLHSLSLVVLLFVTRCHLSSFIVPLAVIRCHSLYHPLSFDVPHVCLFINDRSKMLPMSSSHAGSLSVSYFSKQYCQSFKLLASCVILRHCVLRHV